MDEETSHSKLIRMSAANDATRPWRENGPTRTLKEVSDTQEAPDMVEQQQADALLTPAEVAALFRVNPKTVTRWARAGKITRSCANTPAVLPS